MKSVLTILLIASPIVSTNLFAADNAPASVMTLEFARKIADKATTFARKKKWNVSIAIVNSEGGLQYFQRDENSYSGSIEASIQKAKSANAFQRPTSVFVDAIKQGRTGILSGPGIVAIEGGVPITIGGKHLGAIGVSGAKSVEDEECAKAALE